MSFWSPFRIIISIVKPEIVPKHIKRHRRECIRLTYVVLRAIKMAVRSREGISKGFRAGNEKKNNKMVSHVKCICPINYSEENSGNFAYLRRLAMRLWQMEPTVFRRTGTTKPNVINKGFFKILLTSRYYVCWRYVAYI